jgi:hypothetical protein
MNELLQELELIQAVQQLRSDYFKSLALLRALKAGKVHLHQITLTADGWQLLAVQPAPPELPPDSDE